METSGVGFVGAVNGGETLESPELPIRNGLKLITKEIARRVPLAAALKESFNEAVKNKETGLDVKIEVAGNGLYEDREHAQHENLIEGKASLHTTVEGQSHRTVARKAWWRSMHGR